MLKGWLNMGCMFQMLVLAISLPFIILKAIIVLVWEFLEIICSTSKEFNNNKYTSYKEVKFNKEADFWGLSKEDRRIAKEERMSPADYIEAEERDDDELFTDEWE